MPLEGFNILVWFAFSFLGFNSPSNCDSPFVFGVGNGRGYSKALVKPCMDAVPLLIGIKILQLAIQLKRNSSYPRWFR